jgi:hypothetical protein
MRFPSVACSGESSKHAKLREEKKLNNSRFNIWGPIESRLMKKPRAAEPFKKEFRLQFFIPVPINRCQNILGPLPSSIVDLKYNLVVVFFQII